MAKINYSPATPFVISNGKSCNIPSTPISKAGNAHHSEAAGKMSTAHSSAQKPIWGTSGANATYAAPNKGHATTTPRYTP